MEDESERSKEMAGFLIEHHLDQLKSIILSFDHRLHYPLYVDYAELMDENPPLAHLVFSQPAKYLALFDESAIWAQRVIFEDFQKVENASVKDFVHVRINVSGSPLECPETFPGIGRVRVKHQGILLTIEGTVIRSGAVKMIEGEKIFECRVCKHRPKFGKLVPGTHERLITNGFIYIDDSKFIQRLKPEIPYPGRHFAPPRSVIHPIKLHLTHVLAQKAAEIQYFICGCRTARFCENCESSRLQMVEDYKICHDYQEIKIQESTQDLGVGAIPRSIPIILKNDLVDTVKAGDNVIVTGVLTAKWSSDVKDVRCDLDPVLIANYVRRMNELKSDIDIPDDVIAKFRQFWSDFRDTPLKGRNAVLRGICPQVFGLFTVKLAVALTLIGGVQHADASGTKVRGESHLLLVGDPGTGKSQFLKFAAKLSKRSVITTGLGSTSAGLTVTAVKDGGEWMLEAGALVLADGGLCCIDEFDSMREHDRATIHEAMEQQTISVAKAGLVTTLSTKTIVFGATNPKGQYDPDQSLSVNTTLSGPLLSRFDIVLVLLDTKNPQWDEVVSSHILSEHTEPSKGDCDQNLSEIWPLNMLRRYIQFVKGYFRPVLTKEAEKVISSYYQLQRRSATQNAARTTIRMLESLIRLAQAHARLMFRNEVTRLDAITAILCVESSMTTSAIVDNAGNALHSNFTENPDQEYAKQEKLILEKLSCLDEFPHTNITVG